MDFKRTHAKVLIAITLALLAPLPATGQTPAVTAPPVRSSTTTSIPCAATEKRQFDFWIGDWDVTKPDGKPAGTNLIRPILGGCVLHESWKGQGSFVGESFNVYDARRKVWHQTWVDGAGNVLMMDGKFEDGRMTLADRNSINEISWTPNPDGSVRQHWRTSMDGGRTWTTAFDGKYVRSNRPQPPPPR